MEIETPVLLAYAIDSTDIFRIPGGGFNTPNPPLGTPVLGARWGGWLTRRPGYFIPGKDPVPIVYEVGWAPGPVWMVAKKLAPTGVRSPQRVDIPTEPSGTHCRRRTWSPTFFARGPPFGFEKQPRSRKYRMSGK